MHKNRFNLFWLFAVFLYFLVHVYMLPLPWGQHAISDKGILSILTITLLSISLISVLRATSNNVFANYKLPMYALAYCILIYILREADFHRLFTDEHITKMKFFKHPDISLQQKIYGGTPLVLFFIIAIYLIARYTSLIFRNLTHAIPWAVAVFMWGLTFVLSQAIDKSDLNDIYIGRVLEEMLEVCASGYVLLAVAQSFYPLSRTKNN